MSGATNVSEWYAPIRRYARTSHCARRGPLDRDAPEDLLPRLTTLLTTPPSAIGGMLVTRCGGGTSSRGLVRRRGRARGAELGVIVLQAAHAHLVVAQGLDALDGGE